MCTSTDMCIIIIVYVCVCGYALLIIYFYSSYYLDIHSFFCFCLFAFQCCYHNSTRIVFTCRTL